MVNYNFWKTWKNKTAIEKRAIKSVEKARVLVVNAIPKNKLVAIYIKGSFARREIKKESDVDMVPIITENKYQSVIFDVNSSKIHPVIVVPLSLWEFEHNKLWTKNNLKIDLRAKPDRFLKKINEYKLIYGKPIRPNKYSIREDKTALRDEAQIMSEGYIPYYEKGKIKFDPLLKEVFWLIELEQNVKGKKIKHSFEAIARSVKDKNHIIHDAFDIRKHPSKSKEKKFISKLKKYLQ